MAFARDLRPAGAGVGLLGLSLPMAMLVFSRSDHLFVYQTGSVGTLAFFVIVLRPRFPTVLAGLAAMVAIRSQRRASTAASTP